MLLAQLEPLPGSPFAANWTKFQSSVLLRVCNFVQSALVIHVQKYFTCSWTRSCTSRKRLSQWPVLIYLDKSVTWYSVKVLEQEVLGLHVQGLLTLIVMLWNRSRGTGWKGSERLKTGWLSWNDIKSLVGNKILSQVTLSLLWASLFFFE